MKIDLYEKIWMWAASALIVAFLAAILVTTSLEALQPPSHIETVDPTTLDANAEFSNPGVKTNADGSVTVVVVAKMFSFAPDPIEVPARVPVTFRLTSADVIHGFQLVGTNANAMAIPGYVSQFTVSFAPGEYVLTCNEYCGLGHHVMASKLVAK